jgi:hypothetical protein
MENQGNEEKRPVGVGEEDFEQDVCADISAGMPGREGREGGGRKSEFGRDENEPPILGQTKKAVGVKSE